MRTSGELALGSMLILCGVACGASHSPCGADGSYVNDADAEYCVYSLSLPIVIEGGFSCPPAMKYQMDVGAHRVCSDHALERSTLPKGVCTHVGSACSEEGPATPGTPRPNGPPPGQPDSGEPVSGMPPASAPMRDPSEPRAWSGDCNASGVLEMGLTGDSCPTDGSFACGTTERCEATIATCDPSGILVASEMLALDCRPDTARMSAPAPRVWTGAGDCEDALRDGASFQACEGTFVCAQRTADPCCIEYALCTPRVGSEPGSTDAHMLVRASLCERGCGLVEPHATLEPRTSCADFAHDGDPWDDLKRANLPCEGDFVCLDAADLRGGVSVEVTQQLGVLRWCSDSIVRGQHSQLSNVVVRRP